MSSRTRALLLGFALLGLAFAGAATYVHYRLMTEPNYISPCDISARFNCSDVYLSRFGSIAGIPVALGGVLFFALVSLVIVLGGPRPKGAADATGSYVLALSAVGLVTVLYLAGTSWFVLKTGCILCIGTYVAVIGLFAVALSARSIPMSSLASRFMADLGALTRRPAHLTVWIAVMAIIGWMAVRFPTTATVTASQATPSATSASDEENFDKLWAQQPRVELGIPPAGAKVVIVKFNDWQCPSCKAAFYAYKPILDKYEQTMPGAVKVVTKDYPLSSRCNFNLASEFHAGSCEAAAAVRLATERGKADDMITWLFSHQETLTPQTVQAQVEAMFPGTEFSREYSRLLPAIKSDAADGAALNIKFTPTYYVNGVKAQTPEGGWLAVPYFDFAIRYELNRKQ